MDDVIAGGEKERQGKKRTGGGGEGGGEKRRTRADKLLMQPWNPSGPPAHHKGHRATQPYILITKEPSL